MEDLLLKEEMEFLVQPEHFQADWSTQNSKPPCPKVEVKGNCPKAPHRAIGGYLCIELNLINQSTQP